MVKNVFSFSNHTFVKAAGREAIAGRRGISGLFVRRGSLLVAPLRVGNKRREAQDVLLVMKMAKDRTTTVLTDSQYLCTEILTVCRSGFRRGPSYFLELPEFRSFADVRQIAPVGNLWWSGPITV